MAFVRHLLTGFQEQDMDIYGEVEGIRLTKSGKALWCYIDAERVLVPLSQIGADSEVQEGGDYGDLVITCWMAHKKNLPQTACEHGCIHWHRMADYVWCEGPFRHPMKKLILVPDRDLKDVDILTCPNCGFVQKVPRQWGLGSGIVICSRCLNEMRAEQKKQRP